MRALLGEREAEALLRALDGPPVRGLRINTLKTDPARLLEGLPWRLSPVPWCPDGFVIDDDAAAGSHPFHAAGAFYLQDPSAMAPAAALAPRPGERVADLAAAPGGKTTHLASLMQGRGVLVANDPDPQRARALVSNVERWGVPNALITQSDPERLARAWGPSFDRVLLDAPCSGEGMFRKSAEARRQWDEALVDRCAGTQGRLLGAAALLLRPGGLLAYSTCTFEQAENEQAIDAFLQAHPEFEPAEVALPGLQRGGPVGHAVAADPPATARLWPHRQVGDGHFVALLRKAHMAGPATPSSHADDRLRAGHDPTRHGYARARIASSSALRTWRAFAEAVLGAVPFEEADLLLHGDRLLAAPAGLPPADAIHLLRVGVVLGRLRGQRFEPAHALAMAAPSGGEQVSLDADDPRVERFLRRLPFDNAGPDGWARVCVDGMALGWGRRRSGEVRSLLPQGLARPGPAPAA